MTATKFSRYASNWLAAALLFGSSGQAAEVGARGTWSWPSIDRRGATRAPVDRRGGAHAPVPLAAGPTALYYGGPVTENAKVYVVWWGDPSKINSAVTAAKGGIADFFAGILNSNYIDWLNEYNTTVNTQAGSQKGMAGTGQRIGRGNYAGTLTLANIPSGSVTDAQIQTTLDQAVTAGTLPPPDANTLYAIYFPSSVTITLDGSPSCSSFGAYHDAVIETTRPNIYYLAIPDCGGSFASFTDVTSHELVEAITDNIGTDGNMPDYPQAWNDSMGEEMADLCESGANASGPVKTALGTFTVQNIWDERTQSCKLFSSDANDFNVAIAPNVATVSLGEATTFMVQTASTAGTAQMLTLSATAPTGVTATVSPTTITAGATATLTVTATSPAAQSGLQVIVRADATTGSTVQTHTAAAILSTTTVALDLGSPAADLAPAAEDLGRAPVTGVPGDDMSANNGVGGVGGNGGMAPAPKGCGCVIGGAASTGGLDGAWAQASLCVLAFVVLAWRRGRTGACRR